MNQQMQYTKLYLDDVRNPKSDGWVIVRTYDDFKSWITENGLPDEISFDHDLSDDDDTNKSGLIKYGKTGYDVTIVGQTDYRFLNGMFIRQILLEESILVNYFQVMKKD